ncbi:hypothetical protein EG329_010187 [Mollisiaceae sp. DMI_Dod_QoI]|nr:hypothetical protein EG329_010187 [Helotiales sp. DMI_Dod_QoI]
MKIEELSEDFSDAVKVSEPEQKAAQPPPPPSDLLAQAMDAFASSLAQTTNEDGSTGPTLPPAMAAMRNKSADEILADLNKTPLFMTSLEENDDLEALKALAYEGTPAEVAAGFKERGNESFKEKGWKDAKEFYGKGIQVLLLEDCGSALRINPKNVKAYYRSAKALLKLDKILEADDACARGLAVDPENKALRGVANEIIKKNEEVERRRKKEAERENRRRLEEVTLRAALQARGIKTRKTSQPPEMEDATIELVPDPIDPQSSVSFPAVLLYPLHLESDFIKSFNETQSVGEHLNYILPLPWDKQGLYTMKNVECYMETVAGGLIKVGKKVSLLKVLTSGNVEVVDEVVKIFVLPKEGSEAWVQEFKKKKAAGKAGS